MNPRRLPGASPPLKREAEGSGEGSGTTSTQITDISNKSKRVCLEAAACSVEKEMPLHGSTSSESQTEDLRKFHAAVEEGNYTIVEHLLTRCNDVDALRLISNHNARAPLCTAVKNKHYPVAELLISFQADVNALDENGKPPLYYAIQNVDVHTTKLLLNNGAKVENSTELLHLAASKNSIEIVEALLQQGVDANVRCKAGNTVLYSAVPTHFRKILKSKRATETDTSNNASIEFVDIFDFLLRFNPNVNFANRWGSTPLHISAWNGNVEISTLLLNKGANINAEDEYRNTPLSLAVNESHVGVVKLLVERGARTDCDDIEKCPLHLACSRGHARIVDILLDFGYCGDALTSMNVTPLFTAVMEDREEVVKLLLDRGVGVNLADNDNGILYFAAAIGKTGILDALLASGACINAKTWEGDTPLIFAVRIGQEEAVRLLIERGACVNARGEESKTALHAASEAWKASAVATLLDNGADISMKCKESYTPFNYAWGFDSDIQSRGEYYRNIAVNMLPEQHGTIDAFFRHQVKLEAAGLDPTPSGSAVGQREGGLEEFYLECQLEIARLKNSIFASTRVSYFYIVKKSLRCVAKFLKNKSTVPALEYEDFKREFPIYAGIIGFKVREGLARRKLVERATRVFQRVRGWPEDCTAKVLDFLDDDDLKVFSDV